MFLMQLRNRSGQVAWLIGTILATAAGSAQAADIVWTGEGDGSSWHDEDNWDLDRLPADGEEVDIPDVAATTEVVYNHTAGTSTLSRLTCAENFRLAGGELLLEASSTFSADYTQAAGTLGGAGEVDVAGMLTWSAGYMKGPGTTNANGGLTISGAAFLSGDGPGGTPDRTLNNNTDTPGGVLGTSAWLYLQDDSILNNYGTFVIQGNRGISRSSGDEMINNYGTWVKSDGTGTSSIGAAVNNSGTIRIDTGTLQFTRSTVHTGSITGDGNLRLGNGSHLLDGGSSVTVPDVYMAANGGVDIHGTYDTPTKTQVAAGTATFHNDATVVDLGAFTVSGGTAILETGATVQLATLDFTSGSIEGADDITIDGMFTWSGGTLKGTGVVDANGGITITGAAFLSGDGAGGAPDRILNNNTDTPGAVFTSSAWLYLYGDAVLNNYGTFDIQVDRGFSRSGGNELFNNEGTLIKSASDGLTQINVALNNAGTLDVQAGVVQLGQTGTHTGAFGGNGTLRLTGTQHTLTETSSINLPDIVFGAQMTNVHGNYEAANSTSAISGTTVFHDDATITGLGELYISGGTLELSSEDPIQVPTLTFTAGKLQGTDDVTVDGMIDWSGGYMYGPGATNANGGLTIRGAVFLSGDGAGGEPERTLNNNTDTPGCIFSQSAWLYLQGDAVFNNYGTFDIQVDRGIARAGGDERFNNQGTLIKSAGDGNTQIGVALDNAGAVIVQTGTVTFARDGIHTGSFSGEGAIKFGGGTHNLTNASDVNMADITFSALQVDVHGSYDATTSTTVSGGTTVFHNDASVARLNALTMTGGTLDLSTDTAIEVPRYTFNAGNLRGGDTLNVEGMLNWSGGTMYGPGVTNANGGATITGSAFLTGDGSGGEPERAFNNNTVEPGCIFSDNAWLYLYGDAVFTNNGTFDIQTDRGISRSGGDERFINNGLFTKSAGDGVTSFGATLENAGTLEVHTGTLYLNHELANLTGTSLTGGIYHVIATLKIRAADIVTNAAGLILDGPDATILDQQNNDALANFTTNTADGSLTLANNYMRATTGAMNNAGAVMITNDAILSLATDYNQSSGSTTLDGGTIAATGLVSIENGSLLGTGTIDGSWFNDGLASPGFSPGTLAGTDSYDQDSNGTLTIEISEEAHDRLALDGNASLDGTLFVSLLGGYDPPADTTITFLSAASVSGTFASVVLPPLLADKCWGGLEYGPDYVALTVLAPATVTQQPEPVTICEGEPATFTVHATGADPLEYQWRHNGVDLDGETTNTLDLGFVDVADAGTYDVVVTNPCRTVQSEQVALTVHTAPMITLAPTSQTICAGHDPLHLMTTASGFPTPDLQWRVDGIDIENATDTTFMLDPVDVDDAGVYDVVATNICGSDTSAPATIIVNTPGPGDYELDCDLDLADFAGWQTCMTDPDATTSEPCAPLDFDMDFDIDLTDFAEFQNAYE